MTLLPIFLFFSNSVEWKGLQEDDTSSSPGPVLHQSRNNNNPRVLYGGGGREGFKNK